MAYPYLPSDFDARYDSGWVTVPNTLWDRDRAGDLYQEYIEQLVYADELGFDGMVLNERHQNIYELAQAKAFGRFPPRCSGHDGFDNAFPQVIRVGLRHRFGPPEPRINAARLAHSHTIGNRRFNSAGKRSKFHLPGLRRHSLDHMTGFGDAHSVMRTCAGS